MTKRVIPHPVGCKINIIVTLEVYIR